MSSNKKFNKAGFIFLLIFYIIIELLLYFNYSFFVVGWENKIARILILCVSVLTVIGMFVSKSFEKKSFDYIVTALIWLVFIIALIVSFIKPYVISSDLIDYYYTEYVIILNPLISLGYIILLSALFLITPRLKTYNRQMYLLSLFPIFLWVMLRIFYIFILTPKI